MDDQYPARLSKLPQCHGGSQTTAQDPPMPLLPAANRPLIHPSPQPHLRPLLLQPPQLRLLLLNGLAALALSLFCRLPLAVQLLVHLWGWRGTGGSAAVASVLSNAMLCVQVLASRTAAAAPQHASALDHA